MISPGDARPARPPARSKRARLRGRRRNRPGLGHGVVQSPLPAFAHPLPEPVAPPEPVTLPSGPWPSSEQSPPSPWPSSEPLEQPVGAEPPQAPVVAQEDLAGERAGSTMTLVEDPPRADPLGPSGPVDDSPPGAAGRHSSVRNGVEWVLIIGAALLAALVIKTYLLQAFYIPSASMEPTLEIQDRVLVNKLSYRLHDVRRGDVVVFERPPNDVGQIRDLIKRVIGLPGETVEGKDGSVHVNGRPLREPYLPAGTVTGQFEPTKIPEGYVWMMGDNRSNSSDSRVFGAVAESRIIGRAFVRVWPVTALGRL